MTNTSSLNWIDQSRTEAAKRYSELPVPNRKNELFKYTYVGGIDWNRVDQHINQYISSRKKNYRGVSSGKLPSILRSLSDLGSFSEAQSIDLSAGDAKQRDTLSSLGVEAAPLLETCSADWLESFADQFNSIACAYQDDKFVALSTASFVSGFFLRVKSGTKVEMPLHLLHGDSWGTDADFSYRVLVHVEKGAYCTLVDEFSSVETPQEPFLRSGVTEIVLEDEAHLDYATIVRDSESADHFRRTLIRQGRDSSVKATAIYLSANKIQDRWAIHLDGEGADFQAKGAARIDGESSVDFVGDVHHKGSHTTSGIDFWSVADDKAKVIFNGLVDVAEKALHTDAFQKNHGLLLAAGATIHSMPKLIICTDEVTCAHGASIARLSDEQLFYLQSRGIDREAAKNMVVNGFTEPVLEFIESEQIRVSIRNAITGEQSNE